MKIKPLFDRVLVREEQTEKETKSGLLLPTSTKEKPITARIVAIGEGSKIEGKETPIIVKVGDKIMFNKYVSSEFEFDNEKLLILKQEDILVVLED